MDDFLETETSKFYGREKCIANIADLLNNGLKHLCAKLERNDKKNEEEEEKGKASIKG